MIAVLNGAGTVASVLDGVELYASAPRDVRGERDRPRGIGVLVSGELTILPAEIPLRKRAAPGLDVFERPVDARDFGVIANPITAAQNSESRRNRISRVSAGCQTTATPHGVNSHV